MLLAYMCKVDAFTEWLSVPSLLFCIKQQQRERKAKCHTLLLTVGIDEKKILQVMSVRASEPKKTIDRVHDLLRYLFV